MSSIQAAREQGFELFARHVNPSLHGFLEHSGQNPRFISAQGMDLHTADGRVVEDWMAFWGSQNFGHNNPQVKAAAVAALDAGIPSLYSDAVNPYSGLFARKILDAINPRVGGDFYETVFFTNSGTEAVECAIKMSIASTRRRKILYCLGGYHGTTLGSLSMMAKGGFRDYLEPLLPEFVGVPFNDVAALQAALATGEFAAFVMEPIQIESGVIGADAAFARAAQAHCTRHGTYFVIDEIQTGMHRSGDFTYFNVLGVQPDMFLLGKSLSGGLLSSGACIARKGIFKSAFPDYMTAELHFSTFAGSPIACATGVAAFEIAAQPAFKANVAALEAAMRDEFVRIAEHPVVASARLYGLMGGITLKEVPNAFRWRDYGVDDDASVTTGPLLAKKLLEAGIFTRLCAHDFNTLRVQPPVVVAPARCRSFGDRVLAALDAIAHEGAGA